MIYPPCTYSGEIGNRDRITATDTLIQERGKFEEHSSYQSIKILKYKEVWVVSSLIRAKIYCLELLFCSPYLHPLDY